MGLFSTIAGAVAGPLVGGLFNRNKKQSTTTKQEVDLVQLRNSAEAAGFNPLTALKTQGAGGTTTTTTNGLASTEWLANAIGAGANAWANFDPMAEERSKLELDLMKAEIDAARRSARVEPFSGATVATDWAGAPSVQRTPALSSSVANYHNRPTSMEPVKNEPATRQIDAGPYGPVTTLSADAFESEIATTAADGFAAFQIMNRFMTDAWDRAAKSRAEHQKKTPGYDVDFMMP